MKGGGVKGDGGGGGRANWVSIRRSDGDGKMACDIHVIMMIGVPIEYLNRTAGFDIKIHCYFAIYIECKSYISN